MRGLGLLLLALGLRAGLLGLGSSLLGLLLGLCCAALGSLCAGIDLDKVLTDNNVVLLVGQELQNHTSSRGVDCDVDLVGLDGGDLLVLLDAVADLFAELLEGTLRDGLGHFRDLDDLLSCCHVLADAPRCGSSCLSHTLHATGHAELARLVGGRRLSVFDFRVCPT